MQNRRAGPVSQSRRDDSPSAARDDRQCVGSGAGSWPSRHLRQGRRSCAGDATTSPSDRRRKASTIHISLGSNQSIDFVDPTSAANRAMLGRSSQFGSDALGGRTVLTRPGAGTGARSTRVKRAKLFAASAAIRGHEGLVSVAGRAFTRWWAVRHGGSTKCEATRPLLRFRGGSRLFGLGRPERRRNGP